MVIAGPEAQNYTNCEGGVCTPPLEGNLMLPKLVPSSSTQLALRLGVE